MPMHPQDTQEHTYVVIKKGANLTTPKCMQIFSFLALRFSEDREGNYLPSMYEISRKGVDYIIRDSNLFSSL